MTNPQAAPQTFGEHLFANPAHAIAEGQDIADRNGAPVMVMARDGWFTVCEEPPDDAECDPYGHDWTDYALVDPKDVR